MARDYENRRVAGDLAQIPRLLLPSEELALSHGPVTLEDADVSPVGIPSATVDSQRILSERGDTALVAVFLTAPNTRALVGSLFARVLSGQGFDTTKSALRREVASAPRNTVIDTVVVQRVGNEWRVALGLADRRLLSAATKQLNAAYIDDKLGTAAPAAQEITTIATRSPRLVDRDILVKAREVLQGMLLVDSIASNVIIERSVIGQSITGSVRNLSHVQIAELTLRVFDGSGKNRMVKVRRLAPGEKQDVLEMLTSLSPGPARVEVAWVNLGAWDSFGF